MVLRSDRFRLYVQGRIVAESRKRPRHRRPRGTRAVVWVDWKGMTVQVAPVVLHGKEAAGEPPLLRVDSATLGLANHFGNRKKGGPGVAAGGETPGAHRDLSGWNHEHSGNHWAFRQDLVRTTAQYSDPKV